MEVDYSKKFVATNVFIESKVGLFSSTFDSNLALLQMGSLRKALLEAH